MGSMKHRIVIGVGLLLGSIGLVSLFYFWFNKSSHTNTAQLTGGSLREITQAHPSQTSPTPSPTPSVIIRPNQSHQLDLPVHYFQSFNNCGPATLAMAMSFFGFDQTQTEIGNQLRPYQNSAGDNDDKSVTFAEMGAYAQGLGMIAYHRPVGSIELLKTFIANDIPVMTRTWTAVDEDIGHYRVVTGFDEADQVIIQDDSLQGEAIAIDYGEFLSMWEKFNYEYLVVVPESRSGVAAAILGELIDTQLAWQVAKDSARDRLVTEPTSIYARFNLAIAEYYLGNYLETIQHFEAVESLLPSRTLWYQLEPLLAYQRLGRYDQLMTRIEQILSNGNRAYSELYLIRGQVYLDQAQPEAARREFELALKYKPNYQPAQTALRQISSN